MTEIRAINWGRKGVAGVIEKRKAEMAVADSMAIGLSGDIL